MNRIFTIAEIHNEYPSEWVLVGAPETSSDLEVLRGVVLYHSRNRDEVYREAARTRPDRFAIIYTGTIPEGTAVAL